MSEFEVLTLAQDSPVVRDDDGVILFGQQLEVLKGILVCDIDTFDTLILTDVKEKDGSLLNNREFPIYFFRFVTNGLEKGERLNLYGEQSDISQALRLLPFTLFGPNQKELDDWRTEEALKKMAGSI